MESEEGNQKIFEKVWLIKFYKVPRGNRRKEAGLFHQNVCAGPKRFSRGLPQKSCLVDVLLFDVPMCVSHQSLT